jgi:hypothetical protein
VNPCQFCRRRHLEGRWLHALGAWCCLSCYQREVAAASRVPPVARGCTAVAPGGGPSGLPGAWWEHKAEPSVNDEPPPGRPAKDQGPPGMGPGREQNPQRRC